jgi:alcohol dehydrogenase (cytochrome c)
MRKLFAAAMIAAAFAFAPVNVGAQVPAKDANWTSFLGNDAGTSYSQLDQINRETIGRLLPVWMFSIGAGMQQNATPVVIDGVMYLIGTNDNVYALDAATGKMKWTHSGGTVADPRSYLRGSASVAVGFGMVYYGTRDNHLVALDAETGGEVWDVQIEDHNQCSCTPSHGVLLVKDKVIVGVRGDVAHRSYINAFDAKTGRQVWRWWVIPGPGEPGHETWPDYLWKFGGGATWYAGAYDGKLNLIYWGTGNPQPILGGSDKEAELWTNSLVALDADTGKIKWGFQEAPSNPFDFDSAAEPLLIDALVNGKMTPLVIHSVKSGYTYVLNRVTGDLISAYPHADYINWTKGLDAGGKPIEQLRLSKDTIQLVCPSFYGSRAANHGTYSPKTGLWYGSSAEFCSMLRSAEPGKLVEGRGYKAAKDEGAVKSPESKPFIAAFDPVSGKRRWTVPTEVPNIASLMATGGNLIFGSDIFGEAWAFDATTGEKLWTFNLGATSANSPITYAVDGKQYIAIALGNGGAYLMRIRELWPEAVPRLPPAGSTLIVFAIQGAGK